MYYQFQHYCKVLPIATYSSRNRVSTISYRVRTRCYAFVQELHTLFYQHVESTKNMRFKKTISPHLLLYIDDIALVYWARDDSAKVSRGKGFYLHTEGFSMQEVCLLVSILHYRFDLSCSIQKHDNNSMIYIKSKSIVRFIAIVGPYFHPSIYYKLIITETQNKTSSPLYIILMYNGKFHYMLENCDYTVYYY